MPKPSRTGNSAVTSECPRAPRCGGDAAHAADNTEGEEGDEQAEGSGGVSCGRFDDRGYWLTAGEVCKHGDVGEDEVKRDEKEEPCEKVDDDASNEGLWHLGCWLVDFLTHSVVVSIIESVFLFFSFLFSNFIFILLNKIFWLYGATKEW